MKAIIPLAGKGTRLRPHTYRTPKPLLRVGGRPVMSYILDDLQALGVRETVLIVGYLADEIRRYLANDYPDIKAHYVVQEVQDGTAGAVKLAEPYVDEDVLIVFVDTLFDADLGLVSSLAPDYGGIIWAKEVEDYQRFGVIVTREDGTMERIVEKPDHPVSRLANIGLYYIRDHALLYEGIDHTLGAEPGPSGEFYLTDAFQYMVDHGSRILTAPVEGWYDCGKLETLLETNRHLLETTRGGVDGGARVDGVELVDPVRFEEGAVVSGGRIGPNVTVERGARVEGSDLRDVIVGRRAHIAGSDLRDSMIGADAIVRSIRGSVSVVNDSSVIGDV
jgi:glucose-1-phosphate thymidylyltransferase